ncbi:Oxysterol-binding protein 2 [Merluccius polli]|uniref:Oxysterol-binding protein n=1 Tax=Merluccius polli TaxID=89951 RepID=A0AA47P6B3_MERPO|nr:Oxysterol-binding protein 2 [Merluccius polli]
MNELMRSMPSPTLPGLRLPPGPHAHRGWLFKWTNYLKGYQRRWFVLSSDGLLSYYRTQAEMAHTCRGTIPMATAHIEVGDTCHLVVTSGGRSYHLKSTSDAECQRWASALQQAKASGSQMMQHSDDSGDEGPPALDGRALTAGVLKTLASKLDDLSTCNELIGKHGAALQRSLSELEDPRGATDGTDRLKAVNERATLFRITSNAAINACRDFLDVAETHSRRWQRALQYEREQRHHLEETLEQLAKQHNSLERAWREKPHTGVERTPEGEASDENEEAEFFDAMEDTPAFITVTASNHTQHKRSTSNQSMMSGGRPNDWTHNENDSSGPNLMQQRRARRSRIPDKPNYSLNLWSIMKNCIGKELSKIPMPIPYGPNLMQQRRARRSRIPDKPNYSLNPWSIMKNCIGKELSKIPMPVNFNEPLSMLQRLTEDLEYSELLDRAARCDSTLEQMCLVAAFSVSSYSTTVHRTAKPFNPLLGETYELDRLDEYGYRSVSEQVSHHPPAAAHHVSSERGWTLWQDIAIDSKFRGKYISVMPLGCIHLEFHSSGHHYVWSKVTSTVHNIIVGKLWIDQSGDIEIVNTSTKDSCHLKFSPYSYFSRDAPRKVTGVVQDQEGSAHYILSGTWDDKMESAKIVDSSPGGGGSEGKQKTVYQTLPAKLLWKKYPLPDNAENMHFFSSLALTLNEPEDGVAPTDSRLRPDQQLMEAGLWDEANIQKQRLEERQRLERKKREAQASEALEDGQDIEGYHPQWFEKRTNEATGERTYVYRGGYWEAKERQDWTQCPEIF